VDGADLANLFYSLFTILLLIASGRLWGTLIQQWRAGQGIIEPRFRSLTVRVPRLAVVLMLAYLAMFVSAIVSTSGRQAELELTPTTLQAIRMALYTTLLDGLLAIPFFLGALLIGYRSRADLVRLGFRTDHLGEQIREGVRGFLIAVLPVALLLVATLPLRSEEVVHPFLRLLREMGIGQEMLLIFVTAGIIAPLKEELIFRVILQNWLTEFLPAWLAIGIGAVIFAAIHGFPDSIPLLALALILGIIFHYRRSYLTVVVIHFLFNLYNLVATLLPETTPPVV